MKYSDVHASFMRARKISHALHELDSRNFPKMKSKAARMVYLSELDPEVKEALPEDVRLGAEVNPEEDNFYLHPQDPMKKIVESFVARYIANPFGEGEFDLNPGQLKIVVYGLASPHLGILASRGFGKSVALALIALIWCFFCAFAEKVYIVAPSTAQTGQVYGYVKDFIKFGKNGYLMNGDPSIGYEGITTLRDGQTPEITWAQGSFLRPRCASRQNKGETMRGQQPTFEIIDESSYVTDEVYYRTLKAGMGSKRSDHENVMVESGTPDQKNHFHDLFHDKKKYGHYITIRFDYEDGMKCGRYDQEKINELMAEAGGYDSDEFKTEYRCLFPENVTGFFKNIPYTFSNEQIELEAMPGMYYVAGLDLGRLGDSTVLTIGRYEVEDWGDRVDVVHVLEILPGEDMTYPEQYELICERLREWNVQVCYVDYTGPGVPAYESLAAKGQALGLNVTFNKFTFSSTTKYPSYLRLKTLMQTKPLPRVRYPSVDTTFHQDHECFHEFVKAEQQFRDIIQKRTNSGNENSKFQIVPSKTRGHDDYPASALCLSQVLSDVYTNEIVGEAAESKESHNPRTVLRKQTSLGAVTESKHIYRRKAYSNRWRQF